MFAKGTTLQERGRARVFPTVQSQREQAAALGLRLRIERLRRAGCSEAMVVAFTAERLQRLHGLS